MNNDSRIEGRWSRAVYTSIALWGCAAALSFGLCAYSTAHAETTAPVLGQAVAWFLMTFLCVPLAAPYAAMVWLGTYLADQKGRDRREGALFAAILGPLGLLLLALLPASASGA